MKYSILLLIFIIRLQEVKVQNPALKLWTLEVSSPVSFKSDNVYNDSVVKKLSEMVRLILTLVVTVYKENDSTFIE
ncbi:MAG TPA: hypothetical protein VEY06_13805 [Flavisolibacter sp.]|nr:hypothetical protein [Flavisolibacter sp.]